MSGVMIITVWSSFILRDVVAVRMEYQILICLHLSFTSANPWRNNMRFRVLTLACMSITSSRSFWGVISGINIGNVLVISCHFLN